MRVRAELVMAVACAILAPAVPAFAEQPRCYRNGDIVAIEGVASSATPRAAGSREWVLNLPNSICVFAKTAPPRSGFRGDTSRVRIIGVPPPLGVRLALTGKLLLGRSASASAIIVAIEVISGRKLKTATSHPRASRSADPRCDAPPYGGTAAEFQAFVRKYGHVVAPAKILSGICNAKSGRSSRTGLYRLGFSDSKIDAENTEILAADTIVALKKLVDTIQ
jgi:hypothetical protein